MKKFILKLSGAGEVVKANNEVKKELVELNKNMKRLIKLQENYNEAYHIKTY